MGLFSLFGISNVLYFPGCTTYYKNKEGFELYKQIFNKLGIDHRTLDKNLCSGIEILEAGYDQDARKLARKNFSLLSEENIKSIITNSPSCYKMLSQNYPEILPDWNIKTINLWDLILEKLRTKHRLIKYKAMELITFHDSCYLGRHSKIYEAPRKILEAIGYKIIEMDNSREDSFCCGSCGNLPITNISLANKIAKERVLQAKRIGIKKMIVCSFDNYNLLKRNTGDSGVEILELSEVLARSLKIKEVEKTEEEIEGEDKILIETRANMRLQEEINEEDYYDNPQDYL